MDKYVDAFIDGLKDGGVGEAVICPGSRSTPVALALSRKEGIRFWTLYDERSAAFFALGIGKSSSKPVALVATSGTATANFLPAIVEAKLSRVPIVAITADRPPELRDFGAPQTIDQIRLYGSYAKFFQDMPIAAEISSLFRYARIVGARAANIAKTNPAGPVQINFSFREPLLSNQQEQIESSESAIQSKPLSITRVRRSPPSEEVLYALREIHDGSKGLIIVGPEDHHDLKESLDQLSQVLASPIIADPLSNLRNFKESLGLVRCYEALLRNKSFREANAPEWVIQLGGAPTSKWLNSFCENTKKVILDDGTDWKDPSFAACSMIYGDFESSLSQMIQAFRAFKPPVGWLKTWLDADSKALKATNSVMKKIEQPFEGKLFFHLSKNLAPTLDLTVVVGNSMPLRDLDAFYLEASERIWFVGNKGANGIDGLVSTALGISALEGNVLLILGDIAFYHDMNGLLAAKLHDLNATIIVVNNRGGGIFSFLPQHTLLQRETFENLFGMAHDLDFSGAATIYGAKFHRVNDCKKLDQVLSTSLTERGVKIIEFMAADRETNLELHASTFDQISGEIQ
ncbi:MAG: 2-succinyl-5-enolpyruvyl-6-hydroxy-3-cyclohexene-1-carboxylic-acid synthase [Nitrososphaerota archaeon]|nr:2-succinyl-5-enolpyruvyl-6-hydroxy-3-cyclohexene-1-carboxylic-acid synthase [Nitrososphaerota archaeon]